ncbi:FAD:protein FMN transferase [Thalassovita sp.]|uniref:FAD:protein FMN transferase n=1 Tax=Thalassovita sp. TaxID=1979401 RepID=UPI002B267C36|nr:FAD:protein FMN transferase [Thalassovita sp.]
MSALRMTRRRFLAISAAMTAGTAEARQTHSWSGFALGAEVSMKLYGPKDIAEAALRDAQLMLKEIEKLFSLYDPQSTLSQLNTVGRLTDVPGLFLDLAEVSTQVHNATDGVFDPTVQPVWQALARGQDTQLALQQMGWGRLRYNAHSLTLGEGQQLTFNGIAQGFATDIIKERLVRNGMTKALVNIGEFNAIGGPFRIGIADPERDIVATRTLRNSAIATSSPEIQTIGGHSHILNPKSLAPPVWSTVSVEAESAALADACSTAFCLMPRPQIEHVMRKLSDLRQVTLVNNNGDVETV